MALGCNSTADKRGIEQTEMQNEVIAKAMEYAPFELKEGISQSQLIAASSTLQEEFLSKQQGFVKRELIHIEGRSYADIVHWESQESANAAMANAMESPVCMSYFELMKVPDEGVNHFEIISSY